jgi:hypothetical protein
MWPSIRPQNQSLAKTLHNQIVNQKNSIIVNSSKNSKGDVTKIVWKFIQEHIATGRNELKI